VKVRIDSDRCQGHGRCYDLAPDLFGEDADGYSTLTELTAGGRVPPHREDAARLACANCPESAISIDDEVPA
jgi:ferredoxin